MENKKTPFVPNSTQIPNIIMDFIIPGLPPAETKCLLYICRRTYGFHKKRDRISLSQFVNGITTKDGKKLDCGAGVSRPSAVEALKNLRGSGLVVITKDNRGNHYEINGELLGDKYVENVVVKKVNQLRKLTRIGKESKPKQVKIFNLQYKGKKGNKDSIIKNLKKEEKQKKVFSLKDIREGRKKLSKELTFIR